MTPISPCDQIKIPEVYNIPLRALYSVNVPNLLMAGRNISTSHVALTSTRVMGTCSVEGQAIGTAAALCARENILPPALFENKPLLARYRQQLLRDDQTIKNAANEDPADLARKAAAVAASGEIGEGKAANVINGLVRDVPELGLNRWDGPMAVEGAWIELHWAQANPFPRSRCVSTPGFTGNSPSRKDTVFGKARYAGLSPKPSGTTGCWRWIRPVVSGNRSRK